MLRIIGVDSLVSDLISINGDSTIDGIGGNNKVVGEKVRVRTARSKSKNLVNPFFNKSKSFVKNSNRGFFIFRARLAFAKLWEAFIKALILYYFDPKCHTYIKTNVSGYAINGILHQLILDNSSQ